MPLEITLAGKLEKTLALARDSFSARNPSNLTAAFYFWGAL
jgi:hypothetical protein